MAELRHFSTLEIVKKEYNAPKEKRKIGTVKGKSVKYLKEVYIPELQHRIRILKIQKAAIVRARDKARNSKKEVVKRTITRAWRNKRQLYATSLSKMKAYAEKYYLERMKHQAMSKSNYLDGITGTAVINSWSRKEKTGVKRQVLFIIINHFSYFKMSNLKKFGLNPPEYYPQIRELLEDGLVEKFSAGQGFKYNVSIKGQNEFIRFKNYYKSHTKDMFDEYEKRLAMVTIVDKQPYKARLYTPKNKEDGDK